jgi:hypothetical protein
VAPRQLARLVGVYDADGTVIGELAYVVRRTVGGAHCALCDITHGRIRERPEWRDAQTQLPVPFVAFHRNDQPAEVRLATGDQAPAIVAEFTDGKLEVLLDGDALAACEGSPQQLVDRILELVTSTPGST